MLSQVPTAANILVEITAAPIQRVRLICHHMTSPVMTHTCNSTDALRHKKIPCGANAQSKVQLELATQRSLWSPQ